MTRKLLDRRVAECDRRVHPYHGYGQGESVRPDNDRVEQRRSWKTSPSTQHPTK